MNLKMVPTRYVLPLFLLFVFALPIVLGPLLDLALAPFGIPFHRVMSRALLISALLGLFLFRNHLELRRWWPLGSSTWSQIGLGLAFAVTSSAAMIALYFCLNGFHFAHLTLGRAALDFLVALVASLIVPVLEETIFRGFLVTVLVKAMGRHAGWFTAALIFALAHFLRVPSENAPAIHYWSGAQAIASIFTHLGQGDFFTGRGFNLFLVGLILGGIFLRTGTLWVNAALHGGWILILMNFTALTRASSPPRLPFLRGDLLSSPLTSIVLLVFGFGLWRFYRPAPRASNA